MENYGPLEPDAQVFTGTVTSWRNDFGELLTDSGVKVPFITQGHSLVPVGSRITILARRFRTLFQLDKVTHA